MLEVIYLIWDISHIAEASSSAKGDQVSDFSAGRASATSTLYLHGACFGLIFEAQKPFRSTHNKLHCTETKYASIHIISLDHCDGNVLLMLFCLKFGYRDFCLYVFPWLLSVTTQVSVHSVAKLLTHLCKMLEHCVLPSHCHKILIYRCGSYCFRAQTSAGTTP